MKKILLLVCCLFLVGCSSGVSQEESTTEEFDVNGEMLKNEGYLAISDVVYAKIEDGEDGAIIHMVCAKNMPDVCIYAWGQIVGELDSGFSELVVEWNGDVYKMQSDAETPDDLPEEWQELITDMTENEYGLGDIIPVKTAEVIKSDAKEIVDNYLENGETTVLSRKQYEVDGGTLDMTLSENNDGITFDIVGTADTEEKAYLMYAAFIVDFDNLSKDFWACTGKVEYSDYHVLFQQYSTNKIISGVNKDGSFVMEIPDWIDKDIDNLEMGESETEAFLISIEEKLADFGELNGYKMGYLIEQ